MRRPRSRQRTPRHPHSPFAHLASRLASQRHAPVTPTAQVEPAPPCGRCSVENRLLSAAENALVDGHLSPPAAAAREQAVETAEAAAVVPSGATRRSVVEGEEAEPMEAEAEAAEAEIDDGKLPAPPLAQVSYLDDNFERESNNEETLRALRLEVRTLRSLPTLLADP